MVPTWRQLMGRKVSRKGKEETLVSLGPHNKVTFTEESKREGERVCGDVWDNGSQEGNKGWGEEEGMRWQREH